MKSKTGKKSAQKAEPVKAKPAKKEESSDDSSSEEEVVQTKKPGTTPQTKQSKPEKMQIENDSDDSSSDESAPPPAQQKKATTPVTHPKKAESSDDSSSDEEPAKKPVTTQKTKNAKPQKKGSDSEESDDDSSEEGNIPAKAQAAAALATKKSKNVAVPVTKKESSDEDDSSDEESAPTSVTPAKKATTPVAKQQKESSSEEGESSDDDSNEAPAAAAALQKPVKKQKAEEDSSDEDDDDEEEAANGGIADAQEDSDEEDEDEEEDEEDDKPGQKRKAKEIVTPAKKAKLQTGEAKGNELFVRGLPDGAEEKKIKKFFKKLDVDVESVKLLDGRNMCFVHLANEMSASDVEKINGQELDGKSLTVELARQRNAESTPTAGRGRDGGDRAEKDKRTLFVRNLPWGTDEDALAEHFAGCEQVRLPRNDDGKIRGIAFIEFGSEADAQKAMKKLNNAEFNGRTISVNPAGMPPGNNSSGGTPQSNRNDERDKRSLFVGNLSWNVDEGAVGELFEGCKEVRLPKHEDGKIKGYAFIEYTSEADAIKAMESLQGSDLDGRSVAIQRCSEKQQGRGGGRGGGGRGGRG